MENQSTIYMHLREAISQEKMRHLVSDYSTSFLLKNCLKWDDNKYLFPLSGFDK